MPLSTQCEWWYGPTGSGKSYEAYYSYPHAYHKSPHSEYWDGYQGEDVVIVDNMDSYCDYMGKHLIHWAHGGMFSVVDRMNIDGLGPVKALQPKKIIVISNERPSQIWNDRVTKEPIHFHYKLREFTTAYPVPLEGPPYSPRTPDDPPPRTLLNEFMS